MHADGQTYVHVACAHIDGICIYWEFVSASYSCVHDSCKPCCGSFVHDVYEGLCDERHQEDPPMDNVAQCKGAHVRKGSGTCIYIHMYTYYTWELSIFLDVKVCGCNSACIYSMVIAITLGGLPPKLELLAVFSSSDTVVSMYTVGHALLWTDMLVCKQAIIYP